MNYSELTQAIKDYVQNTETTFVSQIPTFVRQAEERITRAVVLPEFRKNATASATTSNPYLARPSDFLSPFSLAVIDGDGDYYYLHMKDVNFLREAYPNPTTSGLPRYYAQFDGDKAGGEGNFILAPTPDSNYTVELHYYYDPPSIVDSGTSWLGENAETALLYGSLVEAYTFMKGDAELQTQYEQLFQMGLQALTALSARTNNDSYRI